MYSRSRRSSSSQKLAGILHLVTSLGHLDGGGRQGKGGSVALLTTPVAIIDMLLQRTFWIVNAMVGKYPPCVTGWWCRSNMGVPPWRDGLSRRASVGGVCVCA